MRRIFASAVIAVIPAGVAAAIWPSHTSQAGEQASVQPETALPGTGVSIVLPKGIVHPPLGTMYTDERKETVLAIAVARAESNQENNPILRKVYPEPVEDFHNGSLSGKLYKRTRAKDGGGYDGWWLIAVKGDYVLDLKISYSGRDEGEIEKLKEYLSTVKWDGTLGDSEQAFGVKLTIPGMQVVHAGVGAVLYSANGQTGEKQPNLMLMALPGYIAGGADAFHTVCEGARDRMMAGEAASPLRYQAEHGIQTCDTWGGMSLLGQKYSAVAMLPGGGAFIASGTGDPQVFQRALLGLQVIDR